MANYHLEISVVSRGKGHSITSRVNYITGQKLYDQYSQKKHYDRRQDVLYYKVFIPENAPSDYQDLQTLCEEIDKAEIRKDARTARELKGSLPNELRLTEQIKIVYEYIKDNFTSRGLCAIAAIHEGRNKDNPSFNNPHVHILVSTRTLDSNGFNRKKNRELDKRENITIWREQWAQIQNKAYEKNRLDIRVSHESLEVQGIRDREPVNHISHIDWQREKKGERTFTGDKRREIVKKNKRLQEKTLEKKHRCRERIRSR